MLVELDWELDTLDRIFHSEADFQHALAWQLHQRHDDPTIRLERRIQTRDAPPHLKEMYVDLWVETEGTKIPIELKYKTAEFSGELEDEIVRLRSHGAHPPNRFDVVADIERIETITESNDVEQGYVVFLTNDQAYWRKPTQKVIDTDFRLHDELSGTLTWAEEASQQTKTKKRDRSIDLRNDYRLNWQPYRYDRPDENLTGNQEFQYLLIEIDG